MCTIKTAFIIIGRNQSKYDDVYFVLQQNRFQSDGILVYVRLVGQGFWFLIKSSSNSTGGLYPREECRRLWFHSGHERGLLPQPWDGSQGKSQPMNVTKYRRFRK